MGADKLVRYDSRVHSSPRPRTDARHDRRPARPHPGTTPPPPRPPDRRPPPQRDLPARAQAAAVSSPRERRAVRRVVVRYERLLGGYEVTSGRGGARARPGAAETDGP